MQALPPVVPQAQVVAICNWDNPGKNRYTGDKILAIEALPIAKKEKLEILYQIGTKQYDQVTISRNYIQGKYPYSPEITYMHFGSNKVCRTVTRTGWSKTESLGGLVACSDKGTCVLIPAVCGNVSLIHRKSVVTSSTKSLLNEGGNGVLGDDGMVYPRGQMPGKFKAPDGPSTPDIESSPSNSLPQVVTQQIVLPEPPTVADKVPGFVAYPVPTYYAYPVFAGLVTGGSTGSGNGNGGSGGGTVPTPPTNPPGGPVGAIPEPSTALLLLAGLGALAVFVKRK